MMDFDVGLEDLIDNELDKIILYAEGIKNRAEVFRKGIIDLDKFENDVRVFRGNVKEHVQEILKLSK
jgi:hypothetical protein